ncbi:hypothetical protein L1987_80881 [Smallanthus sonchifolius]|uniref:Uncharacterized protein n=1 Tax=Smallanthus sonchifolius TaxID=185202 RepID=A0ACB8YPH0_9ASTR|nr:hypothetical protein L1987_80881 [Smallanthus sonchifolius]
MEFNRASRIQFSSQFHLQLLLEIQGTDSLLQFLEVHDENLFLHAWVMMEVYFSIHIVLLMASVDSYPSYRFQQTVIKVNVTVGVKEDRLMMTGLHTVADIFYVKCGSIIGWKYVRHNPFPMHFVWTNVDHLGSYLQWISKHAFVSAAIKFSSALFGMFCMFTVLVILEVTIPATANGLMNFFNLHFCLFKELPLFYVPSLVILPLAIQEGPAASGVTICFILVESSTGDIIIWELGSKEKLPHKNFKVWDLSAFVWAEDGDSDY